MLYWILFLLLSTGSIFAQGFAEEPLQIHLEKGKAPNQVFLHWNLKEGFGFQKDAPHRILLSGKNGLQVTKAQLDWKGPTHPKKPEYFSQVEPMPLSLSGSGDLEIFGRVFYCNFAKNICIPGKVSQTLSWKNP